MLIYVFYTCRMHICDIFVEMIVMASRGPIKSLFNNLHLYNYSIVIFKLWKSHGILDNDLSLGPEKVAQKLDL